MPLFCTTVSNFFFFDLLLLIQLLSVLPFSNASSQSAAQTPLSDCLALCFSLLQPVDTYTMMCGLWDSTDVTAYHQPMWSDNILPTQPLTSPAFF